MYEIALLLTLLSCIIISAVAVALVTAAAKMADEVDYRD
jgi:hypothetical protein